ncbi:hypothetical protein [Enterococcus faecium]|uniref:hypothetical protein n=1 Tax=Enterococcus faecium TaxID=1352 RepID=UPI00338F390D
MSIFQFTNEFNQRMPPKNKDGSILKFNRNKGYESIPRELSQNENLSYEARGLLISLASYPDNFKVYKGELYKRSEKNGRRKIDRVWEELVNEGYILQFRKRQKTTFIFSYIFSMDPFNVEDIVSIFEEALTYNFHYYHKIILKKEERIQENYHRVLPCYLSKEEKHRVIEWLTSHNEIHEKKGDVQNEHLKMDCSKRTENKLITKRLTTKKNDTSNDTEKIDTQEKDFQLIQSLSSVLTETFLSEEALELIASYSTGVDEAKQTIDILYQSKKYVQDHLDGLTIVAEYFETETHEMLQRYYFKLRTKKLSSQSGYLYNVARNHWLGISERMLNQETYPNKEKYLTKYHELFEKLNQTKESKD